MHAQDAKYHKRCLTAKHDKLRHLQTEKEESESEMSPDGIAFAELVCYVEEHRSDEVLAVLKLSDLGKLYHHRLEELVPDLQSKVNTTRLKQRLLAAIPELRAETQGREVVLAFNADIGNFVKIACSYSSDETAIYLARVAQIIRKEIFFQAIRI